MKRLTFRSIALMFVAVLVFWVATKTLWSYHAEVREEGTNKPIAGAFVSAVWRGYIPIPAEASGLCYHIEFTATDDKGQFHASGFSGNVNPLVWGRTRYFDAYAPGYNVSPNSSNEKGKLMMVRRTGTKEQQFDQLKLPSTSDCLGAPDRRMLPMIKAVYREETSLAVTPKQRQMVIEGSLRAIEQIELGEELAAKNMQQRLDAGKKPIHEDAKWVLPTSALHKPDL